jgi:hypothetical protein
MKGVVILMKLRVILHIQFLKIQRLIVRRKILLGVIFLYTACAFYLFNQLSSFDVNWVSDEYHTIYLSVQSLFSPVTDSRVLGGARSILFLTTPIALYYLNSRMGGEHYLTGWDYPGLFYVQTKLSSNGESVALDPNLQDFIFAQRYLYLLFVLGMFFTLFAVIWRKYHFVFSMSLLLFVAFYSELKVELFYVYPNILSLGMLSLVVALVLRGNFQRNKNIVLFALSLGAMASAKIDSLVLALLIGLGVALIFKFDLKRNVLLSTLSICTFLLLNIREFASPNSFLHYTLSNVYHYKTGHLITQPSGFFQLDLIISSLGAPIIVLLTVLILSVYFWKSREELNQFSLFTILLFASSMLLLISLVDQRYFVQRNTILIGYLIGLSSLLFLAQRYHSLSKNFLYSRFGSWILLSVFLAPILLTEIQSNEMFNTTDCRRLGVIGLHDNNYSNAVKISSIPRSYNLSKDIDFYINSIKDFDCVIARWNDNDKTYTNYLLPQYFNLQDRNGNTFFFANKLPPPR